MWNPYNVEKRLEINSFYSAFYHKLKKEYLFHGEKHDFWEMMFVCRGKLTVYADDKNYELSENDVIFHKPNVFHKFVVREDAELFVVSFSASGILMENFKDTVCSLSGDSLERIEKIVDYQIKSSGENGEYDDFLRVTAENPFMLQNFSCMMEMYFISLFENGYISSEPETHDAVLFHEAINEMKNHVYEWINVPEIAAACNVSVSKLKKVFSKYTDVGIYKYFIKLKIVRATQLLKDGKTVTETATILGFENQSYFSLVFKRETGIRPTEYIRASFSNDKKDIQ